MLHELRITITLFLILMVITGLGYPLLVLGIGQNLFPYQANGSLIEENGKIIGSELIGQNFADAGHFYSRPSMAGQGYDAANSSGSNFGPTSDALMKAVTQRVEVINSTGNLSPIPVDRVTASASGLDPHISVANTRFQIRRILAARGNLEAGQLEELISQHIEPRDLGFLGESRVNVLELNRALDKAMPVKP